MQTRAHRRICGTALAFVIACLGTPAAGTAAPADLVLLHGRIYTLDAARPWAEAAAIRGHRIVAVGSDTELAGLIGAHTHTVDLGGRLVTPGLIDSHVHFGDGGQYLRNIPLRDATSIAEVRRRVAAYIVAHPRADWVQGEGWSYGYADLPGGEFHRELIDAVSAGHPVFLDSGMAHAAWANGEALRRAGITRDTPNPAGGDIVRGADGEPTGWLKEDAAVNLVASKIPPPSRADMKAALLAAVSEANRLGITRVDSAGGDFGSLRLLDEIRRAGRLSLRISIADWITAPGLDARHLKVLELARARYHGDYLSCCVGKFIMDGVIESHTAYMPGGYADDPSAKGMRFFEPDAYKASVATLNRHGFQVYTHAIGDGAIRLALDAYAASQAAAIAAGTPGAPRNRIEHAEAPDPEDIPRFGTLGVIASMQPLMIYPRDEWKGMEGLWQKYAGERFLPVAFALRSLIDSHATVAFGTDWPIVQLNPLLGIRNAVLRQSLDGQPPGGYVPEQRITIAEAVRAYTLGAAYASRRDAHEGSVEPGKLADLVVFSDNFIEGPAARIADAHVLMTFVGGALVYRAAAAPVTLTP
jgi:predicted amidohydrolase YtcJ